MSTLRHGKNYEHLRKRILIVTTQLFLEQGFTSTTIRKIADELGVSVGAVNAVFKTKEDIMCALVEYVFASQFAATEKLIGGKTEDNVMLYAAETVLQLYMAESSEAVRSLYTAAYSMPKTTAIIQKAITEKLEIIFGPYLPDLKTQDFFRLEIASGGIMRGYMTTPCDMWFTMDLKVESFIETTFHVYQMPDAKIREALAFVKQFDFHTIARQTIASILKFTEEVSGKQPE